MSKINFAPKLATGLAFIAGIAATAIALWGYTAPLTGITGSPGALLVVLSSLLLALDAAVLLAISPGALRATVVVLGLLGALGTLVAAWFLHAWWLMAAVAVFALAIIAAAILQRRNPSIKAA